MNTQQRIFAHCNVCGGDRDQDVHKEYVVTSDGDQDTPTFWRKYQIIECRGCHRTSFRFAFSHDENTDDQGMPFETVEQYPPATYRVQPKWFSSLDQKQAFSKLFQEVYIALQNGTTAIAAMGIRAIIELITIERVKDNGTFANNIKMLKEGDIFCIVTSSSCFRRWRLAMPPSTADILRVMSRLRSHLML